MRKIESEMLAAILNRRDWEKDNTEVRIRPRNANRGEADSAAIFLHGNHIASYLYSSGTLEVNEDTLSRWPTVTTKSRLRALGADIEQKDRIIYLNGHAV